MGMTPEAAPRTRGAERRRAGSRACRRGDEQSGGAKGRRGDEDGCSALRPRSTLRPSPNPLAGEAMKTVAHEDCASKEAEDCADAGGLAGQHDHRAAKHATATVRCCSAHSASLQLSRVGLFRET
jgi:hypothetical protein